jgi:aspartate aminotransferase
MVTSHSKDLSIPGERIGFIGISPKIEDKEDIFNGLNFSTRVLGFVNAPALMQKVVANLQKVTVDISDYQRKRNIFYENLKRMGYIITKPKGAFYLFPCSPIYDDVAFVEEAREKKILIVPGQGFGVSGYFRISYAVEEKTILNALNGFNELANKYNLAREDIKLN